MRFDTVSESDFLLTELRYTMGQVRAQILDMEGAGRPVSSATRDSVKAILQDMAREEPTFQQRCSQLLKPCRRGEANRKPAVPALPPFERATTAQQTFEASREQTIAVLREANRDWADELMDVVRCQVRIDREHTTAIAESWRDDDDCLPAAGRADPSLPIS